MTNPVFISTEDIVSTLSVSGLVEPMKQAMISISDRTANHPKRQVTEINGSGKLGVMFGSLQDPPVHGAKILSLYPGAPAKGLSSHQGNILLFDSRDGRPIAVFDADVLTAMRTAAVSLLATETCAQKRPCIITICGAGEQAEWHLRGFVEHFSEANVRIWARNDKRANLLLEKFPEHADRIELVSSLENAIAGADVITTLTASRNAFFKGELLEPGQHINLVGASLASSREIDDAGVARLSLFTDALSSSAIESGEVIEARQSGAIGSDYSVVEIGEVLSGRHAGRISQTQITGYKSHGLIVQDLAAAYEVFKRLS